MLNPNVAPRSPVPAPVLPAQTSLPGASASVADHAVAILKDPQKLALTLACQVDPDSRPAKNSVLAPAVIGPVATLAVLDKTPGTQSAALCSLFQDPDPVRALTRRVHAALEGTGQTYVHHTSVLVRDACQSDLEKHYRQQGIHQDVVPLTPVAVDEENRRITEVTNGTIPGSLKYEAQTVLAIVDAQYLKARWAFPFALEDTQFAPFTTASGKKRRVSTMQKRFSRDEKLDFMCSPGIGLQAVRLPYVPAVNASQQLSMLVVMKTDASLRQPGEAEVRHAIRLLQPHLPSEETEVFLPEFRIKGETDLLCTFQHLGISEALVPDQEIVSGAKVSRFTQECWLEVNEVGTEAAAVTVLEINECAYSCPPPTRCLKFNRPFSVFVCVGDKAGGHTTSPEDFLFSAHVNSLPA